MARKYYIEDNQAIPAIAFEESAPVGFTEITDNAELLKLHSKRYENNRNDGVEYYNEFQADLYLKIQDATYTVAEVVALEAHLKDVADEIKAGSWLTAQNTIGGVALSGIFDQVMKDSITADIDNYVIDKY